MSDKESSAEWFEFRTSDAILLADQLLLGATPVRDLLFHYTNPEGLRGVIYSRSFWASHYAHLNDEGESTYREALLDEAIFSYAQKHPEIDQSALSSLKESVDAHKFGRIPQDDYVVSFSAQRDHLSQWERYAGPHGYAIGVDAAEAAQRFSRSGYVFAPVIYKRNTQLELLERALGAAMDRLGERTSGDAEDAELIAWANNYSNYLHLICRSFKHASFEEEVEWRATTTRYLNNVEGVMIRPKRQARVRHPLTNFIS